MIRVFAVDAQPLIRAGLRWIAHQAGDIVVVGEADRAETALRALIALEIDLVLCSTQLPDLDGVDFLRRLPARPWVLALAAGHDGVLPKHLFAAGARGYLSYGCTPAAVVRAVREVAAGRRYLDDGLASRVLFGDSPFDRLSMRELEVARLTARGDGIQRIAVALGMADSTVRTHRSRLFDKLGVRSDAALTRLALEHGLLP
ncbi:response regulator transcription factor [Lysobacter firmicutimachus]|uniref:Response regulator transcription factor n=1 Tax=Lysobacter firmicutimachus TaxID=1792846 RepID=A0AAU8N0D3_9GAMM